MSFTTFKDKTTSDKIVLCEIDIGKGHAVFINTQAGVFEYTLNTARINIPLRFGYGNFGYGNFGYDGTHTCGNPVHPASIGSVKVGGTSYTKKTTHATCISTEQSFYYDYNASILYLHCADNDDPQLYLVIAGYTLGISNKAININNAFYEPRLIGAPVISKSKDPLYFGIISFDEGTLTFNNEDGFFNNITNDYIFGQPVVVRYGGDALTYAEYRVVYKGYIQSIDIDSKQLAIKVADNRKKLSRTLPINYFDQTTYPDLSDDDVGKPIPILYGSGRDIPVVCTNIEETTTEWTFKICDVADHTDGICNINSAYLDGVNLTIKAKDLTTATFTVDVANYSPLGADRGKPVTCLCWGYQEGGGSTELDDNPLDIVEDLLNTYLSISYTTDNYDTTEWATAKSNTPNVGIYIGSDTKIIDVIEKIALSSFGNFIVEDGGLYTFKIFDSGSTATRTISKTECFEAPAIEYDGTEYLTGCSIGCHHRWGDKTYQWYNNTANESVSYQKYGKYQHKSYETYLLNTTIAQNMSGKLMDYVKDVHGIASIKTGIQNIDLDIGDVVNFELDRVNQDWMGETKVEVVDIQKNLLEGTVELAGRII